MFNQRASPTSNHSSRAPSRSDSAKETTEFMAFHMEEDSSIPVYLQTAPRNYRSSRDEDAPLTNMVDGHTDEGGNGLTSSCLLEASKQAVRECENFEVETFYLADFASNLALIDGVGGGGAGVRRMPAAAQATSKKTESFHNPIITTIESYSTTSRFLEEGRDDRRSFDSEAALEREAALAAAGENVRLGGGDRPSCC
jgi:hypothetical protein